LQTQKHKIQKLLPIFTAPLYTLLFILYTFIMATLTEVSYYARKSVKIGSIGLISYILVQALIIFAIQIYQYLNPPPPPPPTMGFGLIPKLKFPQVGQYQYNFLLQTPTGTFPEFSDRANVYYVPPQKASLFAYPEAEKLANIYNFFGEGQAVGPNIYQWQKQIPQTITFKVNAISGSFSYDYYWQSDTSLLIDKRAITEDEVYKIATSFINRRNKSLPDIDLKTGKLTYFKADAGKLVPSLSLSEADFVKLDYFRKDMDEMQFLTEKPQDGIISFTLSKSSFTDKQMINVNFNHYIISYLQPETYPLTPIATVWEQLKSGEAYIVSNDNNSDQITIRRIILAYYDPSSQQDFIQPIYVFKGDNDFVAYLPAVANTAVKQ